MDELRRHQGGQPRGGEKRTLGKELGGDPSGRAQFQQKISKMQWSGKKCTN